MNYPLLLRFVGTTIGRGFVANVSFTGRFLGTEEADGWWLYGVNPGGIAEGGDTLEDANVRLRDALKDALAWYVAQADSFEAFHASVGRFVNAANAPNLVDWEEAVLRVRATSGGLSELPRWSAQTPVTVAVTRRQSVARQTAPQGNLPEAPAAIEASPIEQLPTWHVEMKVDVVRKKEAELEPADNTPVSELGRAA